MARTIEELAVESIKNLPIREMRNLAHNQFDRLWKDPQNKNHWKMRRQLCYWWLANELHMSKDNCHFSKMNRKQCYHAYLRSSQITYSEILEMYSKTEETPITTEELDDGWRQVIGAKQFDIALIPPYPVTLEQFGEFIHPLASKKFSKEVRKMVKITKVLEGGHNTRH